MKRIAPVLFLAFTIRTFGQTPTTYTFYCPEVSLIPTVQSKLPDSLLGVVIESCHYDPVQKTLTLHLVNHSQKDVTAFNISFAEKYADGTTNPWYAEDIPHNLQDSQMMEDMLNLNQPDRKAFAAGTTYNQVMYGKERNIAEVEAVVDVVAYADGSADVLNNDRAFRNLIAERKGRLLAMEKVTDVIKRVLGDAMVSDPVTAVLNELLPFKESLDAKAKNSSPEVAENNVARNLRGDIQNLRRFQQEKVSETAQRQSLAEYVEYLEKMIVLLKPHCELVIAK